MNILLIHNKYGKHSGEESVVYAQRDLLISKGHTVDTWFRSSEEIVGLGGQVNAFLSGFYNLTAAKEIRARTGDGGRGTEDGRRKTEDGRRKSEDGGRQTADGGRPDIVHIHNLYPLISPAILPIIKSPHHHTTSPPKIVMTVHNYRLICPNGLFFTHGEICEECAGGHEFRCIVNNCENSRFKSAGYAGRNWWARKKRDYLDHVDAFLCLTEFQKAKLVENGFPSERCFVLPNFLPSSAIAKEHPGDYILFAGRVNRQKGFDLLAGAAASLEAIPVLVAGSKDEAFLKHLTIPQNIRFAGNLPEDKMETAYQNARFLVFTSRSYEGFPMVFLEAMKHHLPVIAPNMAGFPEIIEDGVTGLLFEPGNAADLADKINTLWNDHQRCSAMGEQGFRRLSGKYSAEAYYSELMKIYSNVTMDAKQ